MQMYFCGPGERAKWQLKAKPSCAMWLHSESHWCHWIAPALHDMLLEHLRIRRACPCVVHPGLQSAQQGCPQPPVQCRWLQLWQQGTSVAQSTMWVWLKRCPCPVQPRYSRWPLCLTVAVVSGMLDEDAARQSMVGDHHYKAHAWQQL